MKKIVMRDFFGFLLLVVAFSARAMDDRDPFSYNTYHGKPITPVSLIELAPKMPTALEKQTDQWMAEYQEFVTKLVTTPHPLTREASGQKTKDNFALIETYEEQHEVENLSRFNYVLRFRKPHDNFTVPINRWGSRVAYWVYASDQGSVLDPDFKRDFDCARFEHMPSYQHCSRVAHFLRLEEIIARKGFQFLRTTPTYLKHIPTKPSELSDENYVVLQEWVPGLKELKQMPEREQLSVRKDIPAAALQEMYEAIRYAALWDLRGNMAVTGYDSNYYMLDLEEPFNHKPQFFFFQGEEGRRKYVLDVIDGLERMAQKLQEEPEQFSRWKRFTEEDLELKKLCEQYERFTNYDPEYLAKRD